MARKRVINPTIWDDPDFVKLTPNARLLFIGLISHADDEGRMRGDPSYLKKLIFGYDRWGANWVSRVRDEMLTTMKNVILYSVNGEEYIQLAMWTKHQKLRKDRCYPSEFPPPPEAPIKAMATSWQPDDNRTAAKEKRSKEKISPLPPSFSPTADNYKRLSDQIKTEADKTFKGKNKPSMSFLMSMVKKYGADKVVQKMGVLRESPSLNEIKDYTPYFRAMLAKK